MIAYTTEELIAMANEAIVAKDKAQIAAVSLEMRKRFYADGGDALAEQYSGYCNYCSVEFWIGFADACPVCGSELSPF